MKKSVLLITITLAFNMMFGTHALAESPSQAPLTHSESAFLMEANTGQVLFDKNANVPMYPASVTKIATAIFAIETGNLEDIVTISNEASAKNVVGTTVFLDEGEKVTLRKLIQGLLINSGNDAGVAIAEHLSGSMEQFSEEINTYLEDVIGTEKTNFENPHGLFDEDHVTTAEDLAKITQHAMRNDTFMEIFGAKELKWNGKTWDTIIHSHHKIVKGEIPYDEVTGGKNGFVSKSGFTLVTTAEKNDLSLIAVTLKSSFDSEAYEDTINLLDYGFENFTISSIDEGTIFTVEGQEYTAPEKLSFAHSLDDELDQKVEEDGIVTISNENDTITSFQLEKLDNGNPAEGMDKPSLNSHETSILDDIFPVLPSITIGFVLGVLFMIMIRMIKSYKRKFVKNDKYFY
ncbi:D-alanyl-D-alanine carboxypeptidase family protein [Oceanobacillus saliphilus]|uniref:D-alanyl-D-alanine carboxypeptidase family protein n=1 Tax=Oceanobacillus saliphilus TaxID=2925834 RepID=UPI00201E5A12|nr:D-alanyl-D-alanine carboxypeptidase family protein [Oceanobacillus saliphilus]